MGSNKGKSTYDDGLVVSMKIFVGGASLLVVLTKLMRQRRIMDICVAGMERPPHTREGSPTVDEARSPRVMVARSRCFHSVRWLALMQ